MHEPDAEGLHETQGDCLPGDPGETPEHVSETLCQDQKFLCQSSVLDA